MKVVIATCVTPLVESRGSLVANALEGALVGLGHEVENIRLPFAPGYPHSLDQRFAFRLIDVRTLSERLIAIDTPAALLRHPSKTVWVTSHRPFAGADYAESNGSPERNSFTEAVRNSDAIGLGEAEAVFAGSAASARRLQELDQVETRVLRIPAPDQNYAKSGAFGDYALCLTSIAPGKRQRLLVEAIAQTRSKVRLIIAGAVREEREYDALTSLIDRLGLRARVSLARINSLREEPDLLSGCLAAVYAPHDQDASGFFPLLAGHAGKPLIVAADAGGALEVVEHGVTGIVAEAAPGVMAEAIDRLFNDRASASRMGAAARAQAAEREPDWETVAARLLA